MENASFTGAAIHVQELDLADGAAWSVTGDSDIGLLTVGAGCSVELPAGAVVTINGAAADALTAGTYENVIITLA